ncbi:hypothetical protein AVEN_238759-1 [Araneus ventricosus]|uniref:Uncharacterized protein n=1 Tax=Araneus ventricosus TaxID=182803 RepID=A0A4Y2LIP4_ARAVE|nr:hypothetical protein AVEN_238759-1 [Araneus ventricosus]
MCVLAGNCSTARCDRAYCWSFSSSRNKNLGLFLLKFFQEGNLPPYFGDKTRIVPRVMPRYSRIALTNRFCPAYNHSPDLVHVKADVVMVARRAGVASPFERHLITA